MPFLPPNQQRQSTEDRYKTYRKIFSKTDLVAETDYFKNKFDTEINSVKNYAAISIQYVRPAERMPKGLQ